jgi:hypothetical protein
MSLLKLVYLRFAPHNLGTEVIYYERIKALLEIGSSSIVHQDCLVDLGAVLSVFPEKIWKTFAKQVSWLYVPGSGSKLPDWISKVTGLGAQPIECSIGKVNIQIVELPLASPARRSPAVEVIAKFAHDNGVYPQILLGLGGKAFLDWKLVVNSANAQAWLEF